MLLVETNNTTFLPIKSMLVGIKCEDEGRNRACESGAMKALILYLQPAEEG